MIFITVGVEEYPFDRLIKIVDRKIKDKSINDKVFIQIGTSTYEPKNCSWKRFIKFSEMINFIKKARIIITHGGVGTILLCFELSKIPLAFPRHKQYGELPDDHQVEFMRRMEKEGKVIAVYNEVELINKIQNYDSLMRKMINKMTNNREFKEDLVSYLTKLLS